jgi:hypothetical protein
MPSETTLSLVNEKRVCFYCCKVKNADEFRPEWHIDHKLPCAFFNLQSKEQQKRCFHYTNLQPLWAKDNIKKGGRL